MQDPGKILVQIEKLKRAKKRWKTTAICALGALGALVCFIGALIFYGLRSWEQRRAEMQRVYEDVQKAIEESEALMRETEKERAEWDKWEKQWGNDGTRKGEAKVTLDSSPSSQFWIAKHKAL
jgi:hypothetical protein